jgi:hypothetical protein
MSNRRIILLAALLTGCGEVDRPESQDVAAIWPANREAMSGYALQWSKTYGGASYEEARAVIETADKGYIAAGWTDSFGTGEDALVVKVDAEGKLVWQHHYGGDKLDRAYSIIQTAGGDYVFAGRTRSFDKMEEAYVVRIDPEGTLVWQKTFGPLPSTGARNIKQTVDGGFIVAGWTGERRHDDSADLYLLRLDRDGSALWDRVIHQEFWQAAHEVAETPDGGFIIAGITRRSAAGKLDGWIAKTSANGKLLWQRRTGTELGWDEWHGVKVIGDGIVFSGGTAREGRMRTWIMKTDFQGEVLWSHWFPRFAYSWHLDAMPDGGFVLTGHSRSRQSADSYVLKVNGQGRFDWGFPVGGPHVDSGKYVLCTSDGGILMAGYYGHEPGKRPTSKTQYVWNRDFWLLKLRPVAERTAEIQRGRGQRYRMEEVVDTRPRLGDCCRSKVLSGTVDETRFH